MWLTVSLVLCWIVAAVELGRRSGRARSASYESVERQHRAFDALGAAAGHSQHPGSSPAPTRGPHELRSRPLTLGRTLVAAAIAAVLVGVAMTATSPGRERAPAPTSPRPKVSAAARAPASTQAPTAIPAPSPTPARVVTTADARAEIVVRVPSTSFVVRLTARGPCWIGVLDPPDPSGASGRVLTAGAALALPVAGQLVVRLGDPAAVDVTVDGQVLGLAVLPGVARTLHFEGGPA